MKLFSSPRTRLPLGIEEPEVELPFYEKFAIFLGVTVPVIGLIVGIVLLWGRAVGWLELSLMLVMYSLTVLGITVGYHRLFTHRSFETGPVVRYLLAVFGSMALQGPVIHWCAIHRRHHQQADKPGDPHSPHLHDGTFIGSIKSAWHSHIGWLFDPDSPGMDKGVNDLLADPVVSFADRTFMLYVILGLLIPALIGYAVTRSWWGALSCFIWGGLVRMCLMHHATFCINSVCHIWGTRPFQSADHSRNNPIFGVLSFGEGWHNNHHAFPTSARQGLQWWQVDFSWMLISTLKFFGLAWNVRVPSAAAMAAKARKPGSLANAAPEQKPTTAESVMASVTQTSGETPVA